MQAGLNEDGGSVLIQRGVSTTRSNLAVILGMMQVAKRIPFDDPNTLNLVRLGYILSNVIIAAAYFYIGVLVKRKNGLYNLSSTTPTSPPPL